MKIDCAGIVTYNPEIPRLRENIVAILGQVSKLIIVDNASVNTVALVQLLEEFDQPIQLIENKENVGIAKALNQICQQAKQSGYDWCLLLDQDSVCSPDMISHYQAHSQEEAVAILCPFIVDEYKTNLEQYQARELPTWSDCQFAITSGSLVRLTLWDSLGGFMEDLFIDGVDTEYSYKVRAQGYLIRRVNASYILHQQGEKTEKTWIYRIHVDESGRKSLKPAFRFNYSQMRWYHMARNNLILIKKYQKLNGRLRPLLSYSLRFLSVILLERQKLNLAKTLFKGIKDGLNYPVEVAEVITN